MSKVLDIFEQDNIVEHAQKVGAYLEKKLDALVEQYDCIAARRGKGLMQGLVIQGRPVGEVVLKSMDEGLIVSQQEATCCVWFRPLSSQRTM